MRLNETEFWGAPPIDSYGPGFFRIGGEMHEGNLLLVGGKAQSWHGLDDIAPLIAAKDSFDVLFIGTGAEIAPLDPELAARLAAADLHPDPMATPPACRTYNVLLAEGRRVAAALLAV